MELRSYVYLDRLQPQLATLMAKTAVGDIPVEGMASQWIEVIPGVEINRVADIALKQTEVRPATLIEEREFGILEFHSYSQEEVRNSAQKVLDHYRLTLKDVLKPKILTSQIITGINPYHAQVLNRDRYGNMIVAGESLFILEVQPAVNSVLAANAAEKAIGSIRLIDARVRGVYGRLWMSGTEAQVKAAEEAAVAAVESQAAGLK
ncbi:MAG: hypothetical protein A3G34_09790 [Candidatus Lindowbacteria bacterium RIFCSPLOWO2_12_FULL_62_27]|nr:MAG: hypothetical protein A3G34_09790 [Candidatus Lindowbacteria bacterium RIFCSPLOWO2_12_FULL_62_27]OGH61535.1 MAG: hypothetical protein A3I06_02790 [Candidatus Lindowbacteria bacterium RIFCSPLOWO2_02_FULL_62_12]